jgi:hypothetical protein
MKKPRQRIKRRIFPSAFVKGCRGYRFKNQESRIQRPEKRGRGGMNIEVGEAASSTYQQLFSLRSFATSAALR